MVVSSCRTMPWAAASSPMRAAGAAVRVSTPRSGVSTAILWEARRSARSVAWGEATRTVSQVAEAMTSVTGPVLRMRPRPMTMRRSAVWAISPMRWEEMKTMRPSAARERQIWRTQMTPSGSRPLTGSSKMRMSGSPRRAAAMPRRCPIPRLNPLTRFLATEVSPVMSRTLSTRLTGMPLDTASCVRWVRAV